MYLVVRVDGRVWDGFGWNVKGKKFFTVASATRSLHENGEGVEKAEIRPAEGILHEWASPAVPSNERWLHEPSAAADLLAAMAWSVSHDLK
jgi:hypothetical protein